MRRVVREPQELEPEKLPYRKGRRDRQSDTVKHRLDRAEAMLKTFAKYAADLMRLVKKDYKVHPGGDWCAKWAMSAVEKLLKDVKETVSRARKEEEWKNALDYPNNYQDMVWRAARGEIELAWDEESNRVIWRQVPL